MNKKDMNFPLDNGDENKNIDQAARRLNEQILWENTINGKYKEENDQAEKIP